MTDYFIQPLVWQVKDEESVKFHVQNDDYFGTVATLLSLIRQEIYKNHQPSEKVKTTIDNLEKDFLWLQNNYQIKQK